MSFHCVRILFCLVLVAWARMASCSPAEIEIGDSAPYYVHPPRKHFTVDVEVSHSGAAAVTYHWQDFRGQPLGEPSLVVPGRKTSIRSPSTETGYYGLVFRSRDARVVLPQREPGEEREFGFAVLPPRSVSDRSLDPASPFGVVHADIRDPYLPAWVKTTTWNSTDARKWKKKMRERREAGLLELPIIAGKEWKTEDGDSIDGDRLGELGTRVRSYFEADPLVQYWELGIEENLRKNFRTRYYWQNLAVKVRVVREAARAVNPDVKLIYQIAERRHRDIKAFLRSDAAKLFDILSLHPYAWPDFPSPETWIEEFITWVRIQMAESGIDMPIWFTEVGAPHHGNHPDLFFGYPKKGARVTGQSRLGAAVYMTKLHVMALHLGVEKLFWYNYKDRDPEREYAENHFGLRDYWGFPKPVYVAYFTLRKHLNGKTPAVARTPREGVRAYRFRGEPHDVVVLWTHPAATVELPLHELQAGLTKEGVEKAVDTVGTPLSLDGSSLTVGPEPVYVMLAAQ